MASEIFKTQQLRTIPRERSRMRDTATEPKNIKIMGLEEKAGTKSKERKKSWILKAEPACKPGSVGDSHSSGTCVTACLLRPTRERCGPHPGSPIWPCSGWGLHCHWCYHQRGALLPHLFTLTARRARRVAVCFLLHWPSACAAQALPGTLPCGARTFLPAAWRQSDCPADSASLR